VYRLGQRRRHDTVHPAEQKCRTPGGEQPPRLAYRQPAHIHRRVDQRLCRCSRQWRPTRDERTALDQAAPHHGQARPGGEAARLISRTW
jgi:hypothetical protein